MKMLNYRMVFCFVLSILLFESCITSKLSVTSDETVIWPLSPDTARIQYLMSFSNSIEITGQQSWFSKIVFGVSNSSSIDKPYGISVNNSKLYICDVNRVEVVDFEKHTFKNFAPEGNGQISSAFNCAFDENNNMYLVDNKVKKILIYDNEGNFKNSISEQDNFKPTDVEISENKIFICNMAKNNVSVYDKASLKLLYSIPDSSVVGSVEHLYSPTNISIMGNNLYVSDVGHCKIKVYDKNNGTFISSFGENGKNPGNFARNKGIALDKDSNIYVVDASFENVQIFDRKNQLLMFFGEPYKKKGDMWLPANIFVCYDNIKYFEQYLDPEYDAKYLIFVTNQYGPDKVSVYAAIEPTKATPEEMAKKKKKVKKAKEKKMKRQGKSLL